MKEPDSVDLQNWMHGALFGLQVLENVVRKELHDIYQCVGGCDSMLDTLRETSQKKETWVVHVLEW